MAGIKIDKIVRSRRRTISLQILPDASLVVRIPYGVTEGYVQKIVDSKAGWIERKQEFFRHHAKSHHQKQYTEGEEFMFLGRMYPLKILPGKKAIVSLGDSLCISEACLKNPAGYIAVWYRQQAKSIISERTQQIAAQFGFTYKSIKINSASTRWGSCGHINTLNFSWRLIIAPIELVDSVILHELVHTEIKNHSAKFYSRLRSLMPDYMQRAKELKKHSGEYRL